MSLFLSKLLPTFAYPLGAALLLVVVALVLSFSRFRWLSRILLSAVAIGLWVASTPIFSDWLASRLETEYPPQPIATLPSADAVILLGGVLSQPLPPRIDPDFNEHFDRVIEAIRLYRAGKAAHIVVSGGNLPWHTIVRPEAEFVADFLVEFGVPRTALRLDTESRNTFENARDTARIFANEGWTSGLLVTSGIHMPRALATFRKAGLNVTPAATDISSHYPLYDSPLDLLPDADSLALTTEVVKELIGRW